MQHEDIQNNEQLVLELKTVSRIKNQYVYILEATNSILFIVQETPDHPLFGMSAYGVQTCIL